MLSYFRAHTVLEQSKNSLQVCSSEGQQDTKQVIGHNGLYLWILLQCARIQIKLDTS